MDINVRCTKCNSLPNDKLGRAYLAINNGICFKCDTNETSDGNIDMKTVKARYKEAKKYIKRNKRVNC